MRAGGRERRDTRRERERVCVRGANQGHRTIETREEREKLLRHNTTEKERCSRVEHPEKERERERERRVTYSRKET
jgi:hypothetical protein